MTPYRRSIVALAAFATLLLPLARGDAQTELRGFANIPKDYPLIEGIASDGRSVWVSSVVRRTILALDGERLTTMPLGDSLPAPLALAFDARRRWLWIAAHCPEGLIIGRCQGSALLAIDSAGRLQRSISGPAGTAFGDVSVWEDQVFVADARTGAVFRCRGDCTSLEPLRAAQTKGSGQGMAVYDGGRKLLLADYSAGLVSIDLATGGETFVKTADGRAMRGLDGLVAVGDGFVALYNGDSPGRVFGFRIDRGVLTDVRVLASGPQLAEPTQVTRRGDELLFVANAQWAAHLPGNGSAARPSQAETHILRLPIEVTRR